MRSVPLFLVLVTLTSCTGMSSTPLMPLATETVSAAQTKIYAKTDVHVTLEVTREKTVLPSPTHESVTSEPVACLPSEVDFCLEDGHFFFSRPIAPPGNDKVEPTYRYGATQNGLREPHHGVEFANHFGTPVLAAADGQVMFAGNDRDSLLSPWPNFYGNAIVIRHSIRGEVLYTLYGHLSKINVDVDQFVKHGEQIGEVGSTGAAIGNHLHFEVRLGENDYGSTRNPELWLAPSEGTGTLAVSVVGRFGTPLSINLNIQEVLPDGNLVPVTQPEAYDFKEKYPVSSDDSYGENIALSDLSAGSYRLTFVLQGKLHERYIRIEQGKLTLVYFKIQ